MASWYPLPPNLGFIVKKAEGFGCGRVIQRTSWCRPIGGAIKINWAARESEGGCAYFVRNSRGKFCAAGVYSALRGGSLDDLIKLMLKDCVLWCMRMHYINVVFEAADWRNLEEDEWRTCCTGIQIRANRCAERVNVVADCLLRSCPGLNVFFWRKEGLPRGLGRILALEGIPHFVFGPGVDSV